MLPTLKDEVEFKSFGAKGSDRIEIWTVDGRPDLIGIKLDQRNPAVDLVDKIANYSQYLNAFIVPDDRFTCVNSTFDDLVFDISKSRAAGFCRDPEGALWAISENKAKG